MEASAHDDKRAAFTALMTATEPKVRRALISGYGSRLGREATIEAFEWAWEHWDRMRKVTNQAGYLYRAGANWAARARRKERRAVGFDPPAAGGEPWVEPGLDGALDGLSHLQRTSAVLIHGYGWTYQEVADLLGVRRSTVQRHVDRAMTKLRGALGVADAVA